MSKIFFNTTVAAMLLLLVACDKARNTDTVAVPASSAAQALEKILNAQPDEVKARYAARHPKETLEFFGITPGMVVMEALPGDGWYTKILLPYLGAEGQLIGADYAINMYPKFGFFDAAFLDAKNTWVETWTAEAESWREANSASVGAFHFGTMPSEIAGSADAVLFIRAMHNLARFESEGGYLSAALSDTFHILKEGGIVGIVQHMAPEIATDTWASGAQGYLKKSFVINKMQAAGFELVSSSELNVNPADLPKEEDMVWRLPPTLATSKDNPELKEKLMAVGESTRMTLLFRKPVAKD